MTDPSHRLPTADRTLRADALVATSIVLIVVVCLGCETPGIRPSSLPHDLLAPPRRRVSQINLAGVSTPGTAESLIAAGDLLELSISSGREGEEVEPKLARVGDDGAVDVPLVGAVPVAGMEATAAEQAVVRASVDRGIYRQPHVAIELKTKAVNHVTVLGAVDTPGVHELARSNCNLVAALAAAGGLNDEAGSVVEIVRQPALYRGHRAQAGVAPPDGVQQAGYRVGGGQDMMSPPQTQRIDLTNTAAAPGCVLNDRDVVVVKPQDEEVVFVAGLVKQPGQFPMPNDQELRLLDAIALAGGLDSPVANDVLVVRNLPGHPEPTAIRCSITAAKRLGSENLVLAPGDAVTVERTPATVVVDTFRHIFRMSYGLSGNASFF